MGLNGPAAAARRGRRGRIVPAVFLAALAAAVLALGMLEAMRGGLTQRALAVPGGTPATLWQRPDAGASPVVVIAHGFAGSRPLMEGFAITLARGGYRAVTFDFAGHGRNPAPMAGDITRIDGTTRQLMAELGRVADAALALPGADGRLAFVGHSMASDIVVRQALEDPRVGAVVAVSMFSGAVTADRPANLLMVAGSWERFLSAEALAALRLADPAGRFGVTTGDPAAGTGRRAVQAPGVEHVGVLYAATTLAETRAWLDAAFGREPGDSTARRGGWIALLLAAVVALGWPLARLGRAVRAPAPPPRLPPRTFALAVLVPSLAVPLALGAVDTRFLPVLVADYLALHFLAWGVVALALAAWAGGIRRGAVAPVLLVAAAVAAHAFGLFGTVLDRHVAAFWPGPGRLAVIAAIALGAVPFMLADAVLTEGGRAGLGRTLAVRVAALASLALAVALDFERLFFLVIILPVIVLFFVLFGTIGGWVGRATHRPAAAGLALGLFLAWALGVTFPLVAA
jgi:dienelactone hydrolase